MTPEQKDLAEKLAEKIYNDIAPSFFEQDGGESKENWLSRNDAYKAMHAYHTQMKELEAKDKPFGGINFNVWLDEQIEAVGALKTSSFVDKKYQDCWKYDGKEEAYKKVKDILSKAIMPQPQPTLSAHDKLPPNFPTWNDFYNDTIQSLKEQQITPTELTIIKYVETWYHRDDINEGLWISPMSSKNAPVVTEFKTDFCMIHPIEAVYYKNKGYDGTCTLLNWKEITLEDYNTFNQDKK